MRCFSRSIAAQGRPSEYWISICSFMPRFGSCGQIGASGMFRSTTSTARSGSGCGRLPMAVARNFGVKGMGISFILRSAFRSRR